MVIMALGKMEIIIKTRHKMAMMATKFVLLLLLLLLLLAKVIRMKSVMATAIMMVGQIMNLTMLTLKT